MISPAPACLMPYADRPAWVAWNRVKVKGEPRKVPYSPTTGGAASVADPRTWGTLTAARRLAKVRVYAGIGIVSAAVPELVFLDLDRCLDPVTGEPTNSDAARLLDACDDTYAEGTPSGAGLRIVGIAPEIQATVSRKGTTLGGLALEAYRAAPRYLTVTGCRYAEHPDRLADIAATVIDLLSLLGGAASPAPGQDARDDAELVRRIATGDGFHAELCALAARYMARGMSAMATAETLRGLMLAHSEAARDGRWGDRFASIPGLVATAERTFADGTAPGRRELCKLALRMLRDRRPSAEVRALLLAEAVAHAVPPDKVDGILRWAAEKELAARRAVHA